MKKHDVKCFKKNKKGDPAEYDRQLRDQEQGMNQMTVEEYLNGRAKFEEFGRKGTGAAQVEARKQYAEEIFEESKNRLLDQGEFGEAALKKAKEMTKKRMDSLAALHSPDLIAGGKDVVTSMGDRGVNSSIGRQWRERVEELG